MHRLRQDRANRECLAPVKNRTAETCQSIRLTNVDPSNEPMLRIAEEVAVFYTSTLNNTVRLTFKLHESLSASSMPTLQLQCAHDCIMDPLTSENIDPHFLADCDDLCVYLADAVAKAKFEDSEPKLYVALAADAKKDVKRTHNNIKKAKKSVAKAEKKLATAIKRSGEPVIEAVVKATDARDKAKSALIKAETAAKLAEDKRKDATERAVESIEIQSAVIQCWVQALGALAKPASHTTPDCLQSGRVILPPGTKSGDEHQCTCCYGYVV